MIEPWFNPNTMSFIPGVAIGIAGGIVGTLSGILVPRGRGRALLLTLHVVAMAASAGLLVGGAVALATGQPYGVWYGLGLPGLIGTVLFATLFFVVRQRYIEAEARRMGAADLA